MAEPTLLVQLSDPHLRVGEADTAEALRVAIERVAALEPAPAAVLVTGDIVNRGANAEYATAAKLLGTLPMPVHVIPGNTDDRAAMRAAFDSPGSSDERIQCSFSAGPLRVIACDTSIPGKAPGDLDITWLAGQLALAPERPTIIAMHHPPIDIGVKALDEIGLPVTQREALHALLARSPQVLAVIAGHVHRGVAGVLTGVPVVTAPGVHRQLAADFAGGPMETNDDPPGFPIHTVTATGFVSHLQVI